MYLKEGLYNKAKNNIYVVNFGKKELFLWIYLI